MSGDEKSRSGGGSYARQNVSWNTSNGSATNTEPIAFAYGGLADDSVDLVVKSLDIESGDLMVVFGTDEDFRSGREEVIKMPLRKYGHGEVLPPDKQDEQQKTATSKSWTEKDQQELEKENEK